MKKKISPSDFVKLYSDFQGNMNEDVLKHFLNVLPDEQKPLIFLLINKENEFKILESIGIHLKDFKFNIDTHWTRKITEEHLKSLEKYNYQGLEKFYVSIIKSQGQEEAKSYIYKNVDLKTLDIENIISLNTCLNKIIENKYFTLESLKEIPMLNNYNKPHYLTEDNCEEIVKKFDVIDIIKSVENKVFYSDILSYMFKHNLIGLDILNKEDSNGIPLFNNFYAFSSYLNKDKTGFIEGLNFEKVNGIKNILNSNISPGKGVSTESDEMDVGDLFIKLISKEYINLKNSEGENALYINAFKKKSIFFINNIKIFIEKGGNYKDKSNKDIYFFESSRSIPFLMNLVINPKILNIYDHENLDVILKLKEHLKSEKDKYTSSRGNNSDMIEQINTLEIYLEKGLLDKTIKQSENNNIEKNNKKRL